MFEKLTITACYDITIRELLRLKDNNYPVYRSSHAGNWSLYKLLCSEIGLPDCIWDVTCIYKDVNNQPAYQLIGGTKIPLLNDYPETNPEKTKVLTAYQRVSNSPEITLANFHVAPLRKMFGNLITTQSEVLLEFEENLETVFGIIQRYAPEQLGRYVFPCGCMVLLKEDNDFWRNVGREISYSAHCKHSRIKVDKSMLAASAISTLKELRQLVLSPEGFVPKGGVLYSFELVVAVYYLWCFWKFGDKTIYELSGPDMIGYATRDDFIARVEKVLKLIAHHAPARLIPREVEAKIVPTTVFKFGYPNNSDIAKKVMAAHEMIRHIQPLRREYLDVQVVNESLVKALRDAVSIIESYGKEWDLYHDPAKDAFYSQHDMVATNAQMIIQQPFLDMTFRSMAEVLHSLSHREKSLRHLLRAKC